jgi:hypothetical protein
MGKKKGKYYEDYYYSNSDDNTDNENTDIIEARKELEKYCLKDYLDCPDTKEKMETEFYLDCETKLSDKIKGLYENFCYDKHNENSNILSKDPYGNLSNSFFSMIYKNIEKQYDLDLFYNNPTLAYSMINLKKSKSNDKKLEIEENRRNSKTINNKYDWNKKEFC